MLTRFLDGLDAGFQIANIVQRIKNAEYINTVLGRFLDKGLYHVVSIMAVAQQVLASQQHLQPGIRQCLAQLTQTLPGIFLEEANTAVECRATPTLQ